MQKYLEAFLYYWVDNKTNKIYIWVHKGTEDDGYISSSKLLNEQYKVRPNDFVRKIIAHGVYEDVLKLEAEICKFIDVRNNPNFYNMHNGDGKFYNKKHTEKTKELIRAAHKGKSKNYIPWNKGKTGIAGTPCSEDRKRKISIANRGKKRTLEQRLKISKASKGRKLPPRTLDHREKLSLTSRGRNKDTIHINNGVIGIRIHKDSVIPQGFYKGTLPRKRQE